MKLARVARSARRPVVAVLTVATAVTMTAATLGWSATPAGASAGRHDDPAFTCDALPEEISIVNLAQSPLTNAESCGVQSVENEAYDIYAQLHGLDPGDPLIDEYGSNEIAGYVWAILVAISQLHDADPSVLTTDQQNAYDWFQSDVVGQETLAAQDAVNEYDRWQSGPCSYQPPNTRLFTFDALSDPACGGSVGVLLSGPTPPSYEDLLQYGLYDADQSEGLTASGATPSDANLTSDAINASASLFFDLTVSGGPQLLNALGAGQSLLAQIAGDIAPYNATLKSLVRTNLADTDLVDGQYQQTQDFVNEDGSVDSEAVDLSTEDVVGELADADVDLSELASEGADELTGPFAIGALAITIAVQEGIKVFDDAKIPSQLAANLADVPTDMAKLLATQSGYTGAMADFLAQIDLPNPPSGPASPPFDGTEFQETWVNSSGQSVSTQLVPTVTFDSWPLGVTQGSEGAPLITYGAAQGLVWQTPDPDEQAAGLTGYIPSGAIHYYDWQGQPRLAVVDGDEFIDMPSPGTNDMLGYDDANPCAQPGSCILSKTLEVELDGSVVQSTVADQDDFLHAPVYVPSNGDITPDPNGRLLIEIKPDAGTTAAINVDNQYGYTANAEQDGPPDGGLVAGQSVQLTDPETSPAGFDTTYTWQVDTRCTTDPSTPPETVEGVPVCPNDPDYGHSQLAPDEQDLTSGCPFTCTEDPDFHGEPVTTVTGQDVAITWPAPGTYHVRLITTDAYGVTHQSDEDVTVVGNAPTVPLSSSPAASGPDVIGPVQSGDPVTLSGCLQSADAAYATPSVTVNWGDGTVEQATGPTASGPVTIAWASSASCTSPWQFSTTHIYETDSPTEVQFPVSLTLSDGFGQSTTVAPYVDVTDYSSPQFTSPDAATVVAGENIPVNVTTVGSPEPTVSLTSGSLPLGMGLDLAEGSAEIVGTPSSADGGTYPLVFTATNSQGATTQDLTLTVEVPPAVTSGGSGTLAVGQAGSVAITAAGFPSPTLSISQGTLPSDLQLVPTGAGTAAIEGTPTAADVGTYPVTIKAANSLGAASQELTVVVSDLPAVTSPGTAGFVTGASPSSFTITSSGSPAPALSLSGALPTGLAFADNGNGTGEIYGSTSDNGTFDVVVSATNPAGTASQDLTINVSPTGGPSISFSGPNFVGTSGQGAFEEGQSGTVDVTSSDPSATLGLAGQLPSGLTFTVGADGTATISGTPAAGSSGSYGVTLTATGGGLALLGISVYGPPSVTSASVAVFEVGQAGSFEVTASGLPAVAISALGPLPSGLTLTDNGDGTATISGTPASGTVGASSVTLQLQNLLDTVDTTLTVEVNEPPTITSAATAAFQNGTAGSVTITTTGYPTATLALAGALPAGLTFTDNGDGTATISGTPTATTPTDSQVVVTADSVAGTATQTLDVVTGPPPSFLSEPVAQFAVGTASTDTIDASGTPTPALSPGAPLPAGLTFTDNGDGTATISGTPAAGDGGVIELPVEATNRYGTTTQELELDISEAPAFVGEEILSCTDTEGPPGGLTYEFVSGTDNSWTLCASGYPKATLTLEGALPAGLGFTDNGDGSATISGDPLDGTGGTYPLTLVMSNSQGSTTEPLSLDVGEPVTAETPSATVTFPVGSPGSVTVRSFGYPTPSFSFGFDPTLPQWLSITDNGDGTATVSGTPPSADAGRHVDVPVLEVNNVGNGAAIEELTIDVAPFAFQADSPPPAQLGVPYSYQFSAGDPSATFRVAPGDTVPAGLTLAADGTLSGTPTTVGPDSFAVVATDGSRSATSSTVDVQVGATPHALEIDAFRLMGRHGTGDWFAQIINTTTVAVPLTGWSLEVPVASSSTPVQVPLGSGVLSPGQAATVEGPSSSFWAHTVLAVGPASLAQPGGFAVVAPDGTVTDRAGEVGAPAGLYSGTGVTAPSPTTAETHQAFVRATAGGGPVDTDDNAADFDFMKVATTAGTAFSTTPPARAQAGGPAYQAAAQVVAGGPATVVVSPATAPEVCSAAGGQVDFLGPGRCILAAVNPADPTGPEATQAVKVLPGALAVTSTPPVPALDGGTYVITTTGGDPDVAAVVRARARSASVCSVTGVVVSFTGWGSCDLVVTTAAGDGAPEYRVLQTVHVARLAQAITFTSTPPSPATVGGAGYQVTATGGGSGRPVVFSVDPTSTAGACTVSGSTVTFTGDGTCVVAAGQAGTTDYASAPTALQHITVTG